MRKYTLDFKCDQNSHTPEYYVDMEIMNQHVTPSLTGGKTIGIVEQEGRVDTQEKENQKLYNTQRAFLMGQDAVHASVQKHMSVYVSITQEEKIFKKTKTLWNKDQQQQCN